MIYQKLNRLLNQFASNQLQRISREAFWVILGQLLAIVGTIVGVRTLTELLTPEIYGELNIGIAAGTLVLLIVLGPLSNGAARFYSPAQEAGALAPYFRAIQRLVLTATSGIILIVALVSFGAIILGQTRLLKLGIVALIFSVLSGYDSILSSIQNAARQRAIVAIHQGLASVGRFLFAAGLVIFLGPSSIIVFVGYGLAIGIVLVSQLYFLRNSQNSQRDIKENSLKKVLHWQSQIFSYSWPFAVWAIPTWIFGIADRWALQVFSSSYEVGLYAILYQIGYFPVNVLVGMLNKLLTPIFFQHVGDSSNLERTLKVFNLEKQLMIIGIVFSMVISGLFILFHEKIFSILVAPPYQTISHLLPWMTLAAGLYASSYFCTTALLVDQTVRLLMLPKNASYVVGTLVVVLAAAQYGIVGVVWGQLTHSIIYLIWIARLFLIKHEDLREQISSKRHI